MDSDRLRSPSSATPSSTEREHLEQGRRAFERGDDEEALRHLELVAGSGLRFADVHHRMALVHERRDEPEQAIRCLREAIRINPAYVEALLALAALCERIGDYDEARQLAERASELARPGADGLDATTRGKLTNQQAALADALAGAGLLREAIEQYRLALERCPTYHDIRHRLAIALREAGLPFQALAELERILDARPELVASRVQQGLTWYGIGRLDEARRAWREVLVLDPTRREAAMYLRLIDGADDRSASTSGELGLPPSTSPARAWSTIPLAARARGPETDVETPAGPVPGVFAE